MNNKPDEVTLEVRDVIRMPLAEFKKRFGFVPVDALEKKYFAITGNRPTQFQREAIEAGVVRDLSCDDVVME